MKKSVIGRIYNLFRRLLLSKKGYSDFYVTQFEPEYNKAFKNSTLPKKDKKWANKLGFYPWRIQQYGLTAENCKSIISDRDYYYLYPINNRYRIWIDDKLTTKYILAPFDQYLPEYYYHIIRGSGVVRLMNCPPDYDSSVNGLLRLLNDKGVLAAKLTHGEKGIGFYKLESKGDSYYVNGREHTKQEMAAFIESCDDYVITEFLRMHPSISKINPSAVNTLRVMVINENGSDPIIPYVYFRIGTQKSGVVDNVSMGGMVCKVDVNSGRYYDAETLSNHLYQKVTHHPDSGEPLDGVLPNWELVKNTLIDICHYIPQLRWIGFDIAITPDGFKILEVNSHQGLHKAHEYPHEVNDFLFSELKKKKEKYGIK